MFRITAAALLALSFTAAQAAPLQVSFKDLNLASPADRHVLADRVSAAAEKACGPVEITADNRPSAQTAAELNHQACVRLVSSRAMARVELVETRLADQARARLASK